MRKIIFTAAFILLMNQLSFGQSFVQAANNTGFVYDCDNKTGAEFGWSYYGPACTGPDNGGGGVEEGPVNELQFNWGQGGNGQMYIRLELTNALDLSSSSNQRLKVTLRNLNSSTGLAMPINYTLRMENASNTQLLTPIPLAVNGTNQVFNLDLSTNIAVGQNLSAVKVIIFHYDGCPSGTVYSDANGNPARLVVGAYSVGSLLTSNLLDANGVVSNTNIFPNPSNGLTQITAELPSASDVNITLMDIYGKEVKSILEGNFTSINESFDVSDVAKGIYFVHYTINGKAAKVQRLVVR
jgi:hypothetical protein